MTFNADLEERRTSKVFVCSGTGELFVVNAISKELDEVKRINDGGVTQIHMSSSKKFVAASGVNNSLRLYSAEFDQLITEVKTTAPLAAASINLYEDKVAVFQVDGCVSLMDLENQTFETLVRSHNENIDSLCWLPSNEFLVSCSGEEQVVKTWSNDSQLYEFFSEGDAPLVLAGMADDAVFAVGYRSGFVRVFDALQNSQKAEHLIFSSPV